MAGFFGAVHALAPGHGKTLVAAYLVGEHGTVWHALILGLVTTFTHTGAVLALAGILLVVDPQRLPNLALLFGGGGSTSRPLDLPEHTEGQLREFTAYR